MKCTLGRRDLGITSKLSTLSNDQQKGYFSGAGVEYTRYRYTQGSLNAFTAAVRGGTAGVPL